MKEYMYEKKGGTGKIFFVLLIVAVVIALLYK